jgi:hypothetical protein
LEQQGEIKIKRIGNKVDFGSSISGIAIPTTDAEKTNFVFGSDILGNGAIIKQTFSGDSHFTWDENNLILKVNCVKLYDNLTQIKSSMKDLQAFLNNILDIFTTKKSLPNDVMNDFIKYFYFTLDKEIKSNKSEVLKNKYIKIRKNGLTILLLIKKQ